MSVNIINFELINRLVGEENFIWQYDRGQKILFHNIVLPFSYEVHFANSSSGPAWKVLGDDSGVTIPYEVTKTRKPVYFWLYLVNENSEMTVYGNHIPVRARAEVPTETPTPEEQGVIEQTIAALDAGVGEVREIREAIPDIINSALDDAKASGEFDGPPGAVFTPLLFDGVMSWENNGGLPNPDPVNIANDLGIYNLATKEELKGKVDKSTVGSANGVAGLDASGRVPSDQLPSYVDDILEFSSLSQFPVPGESGKIYVSTSNNHQYRWSGSQYVDLSSIDITNFINDDAGTGVVDKTWSANKSATELSGKADKAYTVLTTNLSRGRKANTTSGGASIAFGDNVEASGVCSQAFGFSTTASGPYSHSEGHYTEAVEQDSHAEGSYTKAEVPSSHVSGKCNYVLNITKYAKNTHYDQGDFVSRMVQTGTATEYHIYKCKESYTSGSSWNGNKWDDVTDQYNYAEVVGNGTINNRSNARTLDFNGNERLMGDLYIGCNPDGTGGTKLENTVFATDNEVQAIISGYGVSA